MPFDETLLEPVEGGFDPSLLEPVESPREARKKALQAEQAAEAKVGDRAQTVYNILAGAEQVTEPYTASGMLNQPSRAVGLADPFKANTPVVNLPEPSGESTLAGVGKLAARTIESFTTPENILTLIPAAGKTVGSALLRGAFGAQMAKHLPEQVQTAAKVLADPQSTPAEKVLAVGEPAVAAAMTAGLVAHAKARPKVEISERTQFPPEATPEEAALFAQEFKKPTSLKEVTPSEQVPLGVSRPDVYDPSLQKLSEQEFDALYKKSTQEVDRLEKLNDEGKLRDRQELANVQDRYSSVELERFRRNITDIHPEDLFRDLRREPNDTRAWLLLNELKRQGATPEQMLGAMRSMSPDEAEVFRAQLERIKEVAAKEPVVEEQAPPPKEAPEAAGEVKVAAAETPAPAPLPDIKPEVPEAQPVGIRPTGSATLDKVIEHFRPPPDSPAPPVIPDVSTPLPDLQPKATANAVFSQPFAAEKIPVLGRLMGGKARIRDEQDQAVAAWFGERHGVGPAVASAVGEQIRGKVNSVFKTDEAGNLNVIPRSADQSLKISDVFEDLQRDPTSYGLTPEQRTVWKDVIDPILQRHKELTDQYDLVDVLDEDGGFSAYFPRIVTARPPENVGSLAGGRRVGAKQFFQKERAFKSEAQGWEKGYKYERDVEKRLVTGVERLYRAMADKRLAEDPVLGGRTLEQKLAELRTSYAPELAAGTMTEANIQRIAKGLEKAGTVYQPGFVGKIFDAKTANMLNREFAREQSSVRRVIASANDFIKALNLGFDIGVGQIQLLPTLFRNPAIWAEAQARSIGAMFNPKVWSAYAESNQVPIRELAQFGSSVGRLPEMVSGLTGGVIQRIPILREAAKPFARQFQTALDVAKVELWKAWREITPPEQAMKVVQTLESTLNTARMESAMVSHGRSLMERVLLLAPSYYRGAINLVAAMGEGGVSGKIARQSMGSFIAGTTALFTGVGLAVGMSLEEIKKRLNPMRPDFGMWQIELDGKKRNIGIGGIFRSFLRLTGNVTKTSMEEPENWKSLSPKKNPFTRWYRGHAGPVIGMTWDQFSGKDFLNREASLETSAQKLGPLWLQNVLARQKGTPTKGITEVAAEFAGLQTYPDPGPSGEVRRLARSWMATSEDPKVKRAFERKQQEEFGLSDYAELYRALDESDQTGILNALQELRKSKKDSDILEALKTSKDRAFTGMDKASERQFINSLNTDEKKLYQAAYKQREDRYRAFLKIWQKRGPRPQ